MQPKGLAFRSFSSVSPIGRDHMRCSKCCRDTSCLVSVRFKQVSPAGKRGALVVIALPREGCPRSGVAFASPILAGKPYVSCLNILLFASVISSFVCIHSARPDQRGLDHKYVVRALMATEARHSSMSGLVLLVRASDALFGERCARHRCRQPKPCSVSCDSLRESRDAGSRTRRDHAST